MLKNKHLEDVFIPECKTGPTQQGSHVRFDAWVMRKSWANPLVIGYEIKVNRSDFVNDQKWRGYLPFCNEFYWVCPYGLIDPNEVSDDAGLMCVSKNCTRVYTKKRAKYRNVEIPESIWRYILMGRVVITRMTERTVSKKERWEEWLRNEQIDKAFGYRVGKRIQLKIREKIEKVNGENSKLKSLIEDYEDVRQLLASLGFDPESFWKGDVNKRIRERGCISSELISSINNAINALSSLQTNIEKINQDPK